ncbi:MAG: hypothetical protein O3A51_11305 [Verrucomicrobia bacterium]|nr:hypothetical protein [Verrucomicrobiota bacterium]
MSSKFWVSLTAVAMLLGTATVKAESEVSFVVNALPATVLISSSGDKFASTGADGRVTLSEVYTMPNIAMGFGVQFEDIFVDLVGGAGVIINDGFRSFILQLILEANIELSDSLDFGPRIGLVHFPDPEWLENDDVEFGDETGLLLGLQIAMGDKIQYIVSVDYIEAGFDVTSKPGVTANSSYDLQGLAIQFGVRGEF